MAVKLFKQIGYYEFPDCYARVTAIRDIDSDNGVAQIEYFADEQARLNGRAPLLVEVIDIKYSGQGNSTEKAYRYLKDTFQLNDTTDLLD